MTDPSRREVGVLRGLREMLVALVCALLLVSCSDEVTGPSNLEGGVWKLESMQLVGATRFVPDDPNRFTVEFQGDGRIGVRADCNQCGGTYALSGATLNVPPLVCTLIACPTPQGAQFLSLIDGTASIEKEGDDELEIESSEGTLVLTR